MRSKFDILFESNFARFQGGGFLTGDVIKLKQGWNTDEWCKTAPAQLIETLNDLDSSDLLLRVSSVKAIRPAVNSSVDQALQVTDFHVDVVQETAPGRFSGKFITIPQHLIELNGPNDRLPDVPESLKRKDDVDIKPRELSVQSEEQGDDFTNPVKQTNSNDNVNKKMTSKNISLPGATGADSYTSRYMS